MTEEIKNDIDKLDGMTKIKGKCGYEIIGGCSDLRRLEQENKKLLEARNHFMGVNLKYFNALEEIREKIKSLNKDICNNCGWYNTDNCQPNGYVCHDLIEIKDKINEVLQ